MATTMNEQETTRLNSNFLEEYNSTSSIRKYSRQTAGHGISYLLDHEYGKIYLDCIEKYIPKSRLKTGIRLWEFGCGAGMNLLHLVSMLEQRGIPVEFACGTDFSKALIGAASSESQKYVTADQAQKIRFAVARNELLIEEGSKELGVRERDLLGSFDFVFGVNTIRYAHRLNNVAQCVKGVRSLLRQGGICVIIDMNQKFPAFRSRLRETLSKPDEQATYLPSLDEYARPFSTDGFKLLKKGNFCWVPHSAGPTLTSVMKALTPILNTLVRSRAMRSLVISQKVS